MVLFKSILMLISFSFMEQRFNPLILIKKKRRNYFLIRLLMPLNIIKNYLAKHNYQNMIIDKLVDEGFSELPPLTLNKCYELEKYFLSNTKSEGYTFSTLEDYFDYWRDRKTLRPPGVVCDGEISPIREVALEPSLIHDVSEYLGIPMNKLTYSAEIDSLIRLKSEDETSISNEYDGAVEIHRDIDSWKWVKVFYYLTDCNIGDGHHEVYLNTQKNIPVQLKPIKRYSHKEVNRYISNFNLKKVTGKKGYGFIENTIALHRGTKPVYNDRLILTITYRDDSTRYFYPNTHYVSR